MGKALLLLKRAPRTIDEALRLNILISGSLQFLINPKAYGMESGSNLQNGNLLVFGPGPAEIVADSPACLK